MLKYVYFLALLSLVTKSVYSSEFIDEYEKEYSLISIGSLNITNSKGQVHLQSWPKDKIQIKIKKTVTAETSEAAKNLFPLIDYRFETTEGNIKISAQYGENFSIEERLREKENSRVRLDMHILAPSNLKLDVWSKDSEISVKNWKASIHLRSNGGAIQVTNVTADKTAIESASGATLLKNINGSINYSGGGGSIEAAHINTEGKKIYIETNSGPIKLNDIQGDQLYVSDSGPIDAQYLAGNIKFKVERASVSFRDLAGSISGSVKTGNISATVKEWKFLEKESFIKTTSGNIYFTLPRSFSADIDLWSVHGNTSIEFPWIRTEPSASPRPELENRIIGKIKNGGELFKVFSTNGDIHVLKGKL